MADDGEFSVSGMRYGLESEQDRDPRYQAVAQTLMERIGKVCGVTLVVLEVVKKDGSLQANVENCIPEALEMAMVHSLRAQADHLERIHALREIGVEPDGTRVDISKRLDAG
jgi:hypothetical protein